jgi:hypothetical protein
MIQSQQTIKFTKIMFAISKNVSTFVLINAGRQIRIDIR